MSSPTTDIKTSKEIQSPILSWEWLVQFRRTIHMYPEPSFEEFVTAKIIKKALIEEAGITETDIRCNLGKDDNTGTGIIVDIMGGGNDIIVQKDPKIRLILFRADMDALRMKEDNSEDEIPYRSIRSNYAHMCGHDGHVAALIGLAIILNKSVFKKLIPSNVGARLLFQPAEEYIGGAEPMIKLGKCLENVQEVYGWHNWPLVDLGTVLLREGTVMAHETHFYITINGLGGHASAPDKCIDPLICACNIVTSLQNIVSRFLPSSTNAVVSVTQFHCGPLNLDLCSKPDSRYYLSKPSGDAMAVLIKESATNVISDCCYLSGTIRDCDRQNIFIEIVKHMKRIVDNVAKAHQCTGKVEIVEEYMETRNTKECVDVVSKCCNVESLKNENENPKCENDSLFTTNVKTVTADGLPLMGSEDFAYYLKERPGCFAIVGTKQERVKELTNVPFDSHKAHACISASRSTHNQLSKDHRELKEGEIEEKHPSNARDQPDLVKPKVLRRSNCCAHGSRFDFNDNVLPNIISIFLNIASNCLIESDSKRRLFKDNILLSDVGVSISNDLNKDVSIY